MTGSTRSAIVVGGGIGGLSAALALSRRGWEVQVLERVSHYREVGAGLSLWPNALRALDALGVGEQVRDQGFLDAEAGIRTASGRWLLRTDGNELRRRFGALAVIHRQSLLELLLAALPDEALFTGVEVTAAQLEGDHASVLTSTGETRRADVVVAADGIHSAVRASLWPEAKRARYAGYTAWRLIVDVPGAPIAGGESWGRGERFGIAPLTDSRVYAFATANAPAGERSEGDELTELRRRFALWHEPIPTLLEAATPASVIRHDIEHLPRISAYTSGRVVLLGDAAHAMTPDLGQGACQGLEDAVTLAALLAAHPDADEALSRYDTQRRPRTQEIARRSRRTGRVAQASSLPAVTIRNAITAATPSSTQLRSLAATLSWTPPA